MVEGQSNFNEGKFVDSQIEHGKISDDKELLENLILGLTEAPVKEKYSDFQIDRENEKIFLSGEQVISVDCIKDNLDRYITENVSEYSKKFPQSFYDEIYRLNNWPLPKNKTFRKYVVAKYTNEIIYMRFTKEGLLKLKALNPFSKGFVRTYKHFQFLNTEAKILLDQFIFEATECMSECTTWYEFRLKYGLKYNLNVQMRLFETH